MRKKFLWTLFIALLVVSVLTGLNVNVRKVSALEYPAIMIVPSTILNETLTPGKNFTISIDTDYTGSDIQSYEVTLSYNPLVLHGGPYNITDNWVGDGSTIAFNLTRFPMVANSQKVYVNGILKTPFADYLVRYNRYIEFRPWSIPGAEEDIKIEYQWCGITNGDLIQPLVPYGTGSFKPGNFSNDLGKLKLTTGYFEPPPEGDPATATGPGTLMEVTFEVVGYGASNITLGEETLLVGYDVIPYEIINAGSDPDHIQNGFFSNKALIHDVAVTSLEVPATGVCEQPVPINVTVLNNGTYAEDVTVTVYNETSAIDSTSFMLTAGWTKKVSFSWVTSGVGPGAYTINATATITTDGKPNDNSQTKSVTLANARDIAVVSLDVPDNVAIEQPAPISVTVANEGSYAETVTLTVYNETSVIDSTSFGLAKGPTSNTVDFSWNTSGVDPGTYTINATATITTDDDPDDNSKTKSVTLAYAHDVAVVVLDVATVAPVNQLVPISVTVANEGSYAETVTLTVYNQTDDGRTVIDSTSFPLAKGPTSDTFSCSWNTSGGAAITYKINATATIISLDEDLDDNIKTDSITLIFTHDVAVINVTAPERGEVEDTVSLNVTVKNVGSYTETFNVTVYYDTTAIVLTNGKINTTVTLTPAKSSILELTWNTTGVTFGTYTIKARAWVVAGETATYNNAFTDGTILVTILGDVDGDGAVGASDLVALNEAYGSERGDSNWDPYCDLNGDDKIDASDLFEISKNFGKSLP